MIKKRQKKEYESIKKGQITLTHLLEGKVRGINAMCLLSYTNTWCITWSLFAPRLQRTIWYREKKCYHHWSKGESKKELTPVYLGGRLTHDETEVVLSYQVWRNKARTHTWIKVVESMYLFTGLKFEYAYPYLYVIYFSCCAPSYKCGRCTSSYTETVLLWNDCLSVG